MHVKLHQVGARMYKRKFNSYYKWGELWNSEKLCLSYTFQYLHRKARKYKPLYLSLCIGSAFLQSICGFGPANAQEDGRVSRPLALDVFLQRPSRPSPYKLLNWFWHYANTLNGLRNMCQICLVTWQCRRRRFTSSASFSRREHLLRMLSPFST